MLEFFSSRDREKILEKAQKLKNEGKLDQAIKILESSVSDALEDFDLYVELARDYFESGRRIDAVASLRKALAIDGQRADEVVGVLSDLHYRGSAPIETGDALLEIYTSRRDFEEIERTLKSLVPRDLQLLDVRYAKIYENTFKNKSPKDYTTRELNILIQLASVNIFLGRIERAMELAEKFFEVPDREFSVIEKWARSVGRWRWGKPEPQFYLMRLYLAFHRYEEALQAAQRTIEFDKTYNLRIHEEFSRVTLPANIQVEFLQFLSSLEVGVKDIDNAIGNLNRLLNLDPGRIEDVIRGFRELLRIAPKETKVLFALGDAYLHAHRASLAVEEYAKVIDIDPGKIDEVLKRYHLVLKSDPTNPQVISALVEGYLRKGDTQHATEVIEESFKTDPGLVDEYLLNLNTILEKDINNLRALNLLGLVYLKKGEIDNAVLIFENLAERGGEGQSLAEAGVRAILNSAPDNLQAIKIIIDILRQQKRIAEALSLIASRVKAEPKTALELLPKVDELIKTDKSLVSSGRAIYQEFKGEDEFLIQLVIGRSYAYEKNYTRAIESFQKCLEIDPGRSELLKKGIVEIIQDDSGAVPLMVYVARLYLRDGNIEASARFFRAAQMVDPSIFSEIIDDFYDIVKAHPEDVMLRRLLVDSLFNKGLYDRTIEECRITVEAVNPKDGAYFNLRQAQALVAKGRLTDAVRPFMLAQENNPEFTGEVIAGLEKILAIDKNNIPAHFALGRAYGAARKVNQAVEELLHTARIVPTRINYVMEELKRLEELAPANALVHFARALLLLDQKNYSEGISEIDQAREMDKSLLDRILPIYNRLEAEAPSPELFLNQAKAFTDKGLYEPAVDYFRKAFEGDPKLLEQIISGLKTICSLQPQNPEARRLLARIYFEYNALDDAVSVAREMYGVSPAYRTWTIEFTDEILDKNPKHIQTYYFRAELCFDEGKFKEGIEALGRLKDFAPHEILTIINFVESELKEEQFVPEILLFLADRYIEIAQEAKALTYLSRLFNTDPSFADAVLFRLKNMLKRRPDIMGAYFLMADILSAQNDFQRAREALEFGERYATEINDKVELRLRLANLLNNLGDMAGVSNALIKALRISPNKSSVYRTIQTLHERSLNNRLEVLKHQTTEESRLEMARVYLGLKQYDEAEKALSFIPSDPETKRKQALLRARILLTRNRALDALELLKPYKDDERITLTLVEVYETVGNYAAAIGLLKELSREEFKNRIQIDEVKLVERFLTGKRSILEGRRQ